MKSSPPATENLLFVGFCALLAFGPLAFGGVQPWALCALEVAAALLLILWSLNQIFSPKQNIILTPLWLPVALYALLVVCQLIFHRTAYRDATWSRAMLWASYACLLFLAPQLLRRRSRLKLFAILLSVYGFAVAFFGVVQQLSWNGKIYWTIPNPQGGWVYGPYVNHAHYAGLMELLVPLPIIFAMSDYLGRPVRILSLFAAVIMSSTIFLCQSVGGVLAFTFELLFIFGLVLLPARKVGRLMLVMGVLCVSLIGILAALHPGGLVGRLAQLHAPFSKDFAADRLAILRDSFKLLKARPLTGWGLGTFPVVYPSFRSFYSDYWINEAHNDYVQTFVETGLLGFAILAFFLVTLYRNGIKNIRMWRQDSTSSIGLAALVGCTGLLVHGLGDFNLQIPANAALFFTLAAIATAPHDLSSRPRVKTQVRVSRSGAAMSAGRSTSY